MGQAALGQAGGLGTGVAKPGTAYLNLGTGGGFSNRQIIKTVEKITGKPVPVVEAPRRPGDAVALYADPKKAKDVLGWEARYKDP